MHACMYVCMHGCDLVSASEEERRYTVLYMHVCTYVYMYIRMHACMHVIFWNLLSKEERRYTVLCMHVCACECMFFVRVRNTFSVYVYTYVCMYVCVLVSDAHVRCTWREGNECMRVRMYVFECHTHILTFSARSSRLAE